jgi:hypothetical protein
LVMRTKTTNQPYYEIIATAEINVLLDTPLQSVYEQLG